MGRPAARLTPAALETLMQFDWPGNVRELENEIERALTLAGDDGEIKLEYLSERIKGSAENQVQTDEAPISLQEATARLERKVVEDALRQTGGNRSRAARILGLTREGLLDKITRYQIDL